MNHIFADMVRQGILVVYMDDLLIHTHTKEQHRDALKEVLSRFQQHHLFLRPEKCSFYQTECEYLGHIVSHNHIEMDPAKTTAITDWPTLKTLKQLQSFLGFANFYRHFIPGYAQIAAPLHFLQKKDTLFKWGDEQELAFKTLKQLFTQKPVLLQPDLSKPFRVETDASTVAVGAVLSQKGEDDNWHPIAYLSKTNLPAESRYTAHDLELLTIVKALKHWRHYLLGSPHRIGIWTDHNNLQYFTTGQLLSPRQA